MTCAIPTSADQRLERSLYFPVRSAGERSDGTTVEPGALQTRTRKQSLKTELLRAKRAQRIPFWPGDQPVMLTFCLRQSGGPYIPDGRLERSRWRGGRFACTSLIRRWSLEGLTVVRYDDVNMDSDVSSISMSINNGLLTQLLSIQQFPTQSRFKSHSSPRPPQTPAASF